MKTSSAGRALVVAREGRRLSAYRDSVGVWTIGVGHTGRMAPPPVKPGMRIDEAQCDAFLAADLGPVERVLNTAVTVPLTQNEFDAVASLGFNIGVGGLARSSVIKRLNLGDIQGAAGAFLAWSKPAVLIGRRKAERVQFLTPDLSATPVAHTVMASRAEALAAKAAATKADARLGTKTAGGIGAASVAVAAAQPAVHQHHAVLWVGFAVGLAVAIVAAVTAVRAHRKAATLAANAEAQALAARSLGAETTDIVDAPQQ